MLFFLNQILNHLGTVLSSQHLAQTNAVETKSVGLVTSEESVQEPSARPEWRPNSLKVCCLASTVCCYKITGDYWPIAIAYLVDHMGNMDTPSKHRTTCLFYRLNKPFGMLEDHSNIL